MKRWIFGMLVCALFCVCGCSADADVLLGNSLSAQEEDAVDEQAEEEEFDAAACVEDSAEDTSCFVYICGAVVEPGVYELAAGSRIYELVELAGGLSADADEQSVNLAETIQDGEMIWIPTVSESEALAQASAASSSSSAASLTDSGKININTASASELTQLNGIGESKAAAIVSYRESNGAFASIEEIMQVDGIAEGTYEKIKDNITV